MKTKRKMIIALRFTLLALVVCFIVFTTFFIKNPLLCFFVGFLIGAIYSLSGYVEALYFFSIIPICSFLLFIIPFKPETKTQDLILLVDGGYMFGTISLIILWTFIDNTFFKGREESIIEFLKLKISNWFLLEEKTEYEN